MDNLSALILFAMAATISPGGATAMATTSGARFGYMRSLPVISGIAFALAGIACLSGAGLSGLLIGVPFLAMAIKTLGTAYLLWLAVQISMAGQPGQGDAADEGPMTFLQGALLLALNPKAWAMGLGVASSFSDTASPPIASGVVLAAVFAACAGLSLSLWALTGRFVARILTTKTHWAAFNFTMALLLLASVLQLWR